MTYLKLLTAFIVALSLISCNKNNDEKQSKVETDNYSQNKIKSDSKKFMGQELGKAVSGAGDFYYDEDKGCFLKIQEGVIADCMLKTKLVYKIGVNCEKNKNLISIDEIVCGEKISDISSFKKLCSEVTINDGFYLRKSNSFFWVDIDLVVTRLGIVSDNEGLGEEGEGAYSAENCNALSKEKKS